MGFVQNVGKLCTCIVCVFGLIKSHLATAASSGGRVGPTQSRMAEAWQHPCPFSLQGGRRFVLLDVHDVLLEQIGCVFKCDI